MAVQGWQEDEHAGAEGVAWGWESKAQLLLSLPHSWPHLGVIV